MIFKWKWKKIQKFTFQYVVTDYYCRMLGIMEEEFYFRWLVIEFGDGFIEIIEEYSFFELFYRKKNRSYFIQNRRQYNSSMNSQWNYCYLSNRCQISTPCYVYFFFFEYIQKYTIKRKLIVIKLKKWRNYIEACILVLICHKTRCELKSL